MLDKKKNIFSDIDSRKLAIYVTPVAEAALAFVTTPSTEYKENGQYFIRIRLKADDKETQTLVDLIEKERKAAFDMAMERLETPKEKKALKLATPAYHAEEDDDGNETGYIVFNFKRNATYTDKKSGKLKALVLPIFDSMGQPVDKDGLEVWSGSIVTVAFRLKPFYTSQLGVGVTQHLEAVQLIKVVSGSAKTADGYGFKKQQGGFVEEAKDTDDDADEESSEESYEESSEESSEEAATADKRPVPGDDGDY